MKPSRLNRRQLLLAGGACALPTAFAQSRPAWAAIEQAARGQTVFWNAWAGSEQTNAYLQWVAQQLKASHGITLQHVKITDTADVVKRVRAEKAAGRGVGEGRLQDRGPSGTWTELPASSINHCLTVAAAGRSGSLPWCTR